MRERDRPMRDQESPFTSFMRTHRSRGSSVRIIAGLVLVVLLGVAGWYAFRARATDPVADSDGVPIASGTPDPATGPAGESAIDLPPLDASDELVRQLFSRLSSHPQLAAWLLTEDLIHRFVATVADLAYGLSPAPHLRFMQPVGEFTVRQSDGELRIDPASYRRYDLMTATFVSLDTDGTARLMRQLHPLFVEAHERLGLPDRTFDGDLARAVANLQTAQVPAQPPVVLHGEGGYTFRDESLETGSSAQKHLIRAGPDNARRIQAKLAEIAAALGVPRPD
jgi:hypothetical protein